MMKATLDVSKLVCLGICDGVSFVFSSYLGIYIAKAVDIREVCGLVQVFTQ